MAYSILKDGLAYTFSALITRGLSFFLIPVYMSVLTPADYGSLDLLLVFANLVNLTIALEVSQGLARFYPSETVSSARTAYFSTAFWFTVFIYSAFSLIIGFFADKIGAMVMRREGMTDVFVACIFYIWSNGIFSLVLNQFRWNMQSRNYAFISLLVALVSAFMSIVFLYIFNFGVFSVVFGWFLGAFIGLIYCLCVLRNQIVCKFDFLRLKEMLVFSTPLVFSGFAVFLNSYIDRIMISQYLSIDELGVYGVGFRLSSAIGLIAIGFNNAMVPYVYKYFGNEDTPIRIAGMFRVFVAFSLFSIILLNIIARDFLTIVNRPGYSNAGDVFDFLIPAVLVGQMYIFAPGIDIARKTYLVLLINVFGAVLNIVLNYFTIPIFGVQGAAFSTFVGSCAVFILYMTFSQKFYPVLHNWIRIWTAIFLVIMLHFFAKFMNVYNYSNLLLKIFLLLACVLVLFLARLISYEDMVKIKKIF